MASLRAAGHEPWLLAPAAPGSALVGPGPGEVAGLIAWDRAEIAGLLAEGGLPPGALRDEIAVFDVAIAYTRSAALRNGLSAAVPRVLEHDPLPPPGGAHASSWLAEPLGRLSVPWLADVPLLRPTPAEEAAAQPLLRRLPGEFLAVHPGSGALAKNWPVERFVAIVERVAPRAPFLLVEGPADGAAAGRLARVPRAVPARSLPGRVLGALLARAGLYLGNDSGVSHLAAAYGAPTVALFGPTDPAIWGPVGPRVTTIKSATGTMAGITVDTVASALRG